MRLKKHTVWVVSELYYPLETSTGHLLTCTAEGLVQKYDVRVLSRKSSDAVRGCRLGPQEVRNGVTIYRCWGTRFNKDRLLLRVINILTISLTVFCQAAVRVRRNDCVLVVTNPPALPFLMRVVCWMRCARLILLVHDVYPEALVAAGVASADSWVTKILAWKTAQLYASCKRVVVLGRDMYLLVASKISHGVDRIRIIQNWADLELVRPLPRENNRLLEEYEIFDKFVVQYAGNMGRTHGLEYVVEVARRLKTRRGDIHFMLVGGGAKKKWIEDRITAESLSNITLVGNRPRKDQSNFLNACDLAIISFVPQMAGVSVPSRTYNTMAAGSPILAVADEHSELAQVVKEEGIGWVVTPGDIEGLERAILQAADQPSNLRAMATRARIAVEKKYTLQHAIEKYEKLIEELVGR